MAQKKDVILLNQELGGIEIYPLAHKDHYQQVIYDTYARKEVDTFVVPQALWSDNGTYCSCELNENSGSGFEKLKYIKATDSPVWDVSVDPVASGTDYKVQIKNRAYVTTLITNDKSITLMAMKAPSTDITLTLKGLDLNERS